ASVRARGSPTLAPSKRRSLRSDVTHKLWTPCATILPSWCGEALRHASQRGQTAPLLGRGLRSGPATSGSAAATSTDEPQLDNQNVTDAWVPEAVGGLWGGVELPPAQTSGTLLPVAFVLHLPRDMARRLETSNNCEQMAPSEALWG
ncbi:unnamed protein product, partial [Prorocentrum cordatum]